MEAYIGAGSKLIFLDSKGNCFIANEAKGNWQSDCWFSNYSYRTQTYKVKTNYPKAKTTTFYPNYQSNLIDDLDDNDKDFGYVPHDTDGKVQIPKWYKEYKEDKAIEEAKLKPEMVGKCAFLKQTVPVDNPTYTDEKCLYGTKVRIDYILTLNKMLAVSTPDTNKSMMISPDQISIPFTDSSVKAKSDGFMMDGTVIFTKNYNHFRIGDQEVSKIVTPKHVIIELPSKKRHFVPKEVIRPSYLTNGDL